MTRLTLKPAAFQILVALLDGESHGYALMQGAREHSRGEHQLSTASFYRHLQKLIEQGLVEVTARPADADPRRGDYYRLTANGRHVLIEEKAHLTALLTALDGIQPAGRRTRS